jgi:hypothetical protein
VLTRACARATRTPPPPSPRFLLPPPPPPPPDPHLGRRSFTGELVGASDDELTLAADDGVVTIPYTAIQRSNLLGD